MSHDKIKRERGVMNASGVTAKGVGPGLASRPISFGSGLSPQSHMPPRQSGWSPVYLGSSSAFHVT